ncbi:hypothetical protein H5T88_00560 [bacterium]|nr:hypothetical protein [bacterium]
MRKQDGEWTHYFLSGKVRDALSGNPIVETIVKGGNVLLIGNASAISSKFFGVEKLTARAFPIQKKAMVDIRLSP